MNSLAIGGIVSGMDTNSLVEKLVSQARIPLTNLENKYELKTLEKNIYTNYSDKLKVLKSDVLTLRLESTLKTKSANSSNSTMLSATASVNAAVGSHTVKINQTAINAYHYSQYTSVSLSESGAGVTALSGSPTDFLEGVHSVSSYQSGSYYIAKDSFASNSGSMTKNIGSNNISNVGADGYLTGAAINGTLDFVVDSTAISVSISSSAGEDINEVTKQVESSLNTQLNSQFNTSNFQYVSVRADYDSAGGSWKFAIYNTSAKDYSMTISNTGTATALTGLSSYSTTTASNIDKYFVHSSGYSSLLTKLNDSDSGLIPGVTLTASSFTNGSFSIVQDASLKVSAGTYTKITGATVSSGSGLNMTVSGLQNAGFATTPTASTNGTFTINDVEITLDDYTTMTANELLAKINSSAAGVTASYDSVNDKIILRSNTIGSSTISLGDYSDTSNVLSILKLSSASGAVTVQGKSEGTLDTTAVLSQAGFSRSVTSGTFSINGISIYVNSTTDTLNDVIYKINNSGADVTVSYDENSDKMTIKSNGINKITFGSTSDTSTFLRAVNFTDSPTTSKELGFSGQYAKVNVDGIDYIRKSNEIDDIITGVTLNLKNASEDYASIDITSDTSKGILAIAKFVQHYNELIEELNPPEIDDDDEKYLEALSDDDAANMSDDEVSAYNEKWQTFNTYEIIRKSSEFRQLKNSLRSNLLSDITGITGKFSNLSEIGLEIAGKDDLDVLKKGYFVTDSTDYDTIKQALEDNTDLMENLTKYSDDVYTLFAQNKDTAKGWAKRYETMIGQYTNVDGTIYNKIKTGGSFDTSLYNLALQMDSMQTRVDAYYDRLWTQFSNMESKIASLQESSSALSNLTSA